MKTPFAALILLLGALFAQAEPHGFVWRDSDGKPVPDTASMKSKNGFGGQFIITANENIYAEWAKPMHPKIDRADKLPVGKLLVPVVIYVNPKKDENGLIDVTYDLEILKPDGSLARKVSDNLIACSVLGGVMWILLGPEMWRIVLAGFVGGSVGILIGEGSLWRKNEARFASIEEQINGAQLRT